MRFFEVLVSKASAILFPVLRLVGDSGRYNTIFKVTQCPRLLGTNSQTTYKFDKEGPFFDPHNVRKSRCAKMASAVQDSSRSCCWSNQLQLEINALTHLPQ